MRMTQKIFVFAGVMSWLALPVSADEHRQLGAHVHGHGRLNIAIEDKTVSIELSVPGADIVGFEHEATTATQKAALDKAKVTLADGLTLFTPPASAGCVQKNAKVAVEAEHEHGEKHEHHAHDEEGAAPENEAEHHHSEFHVEYAFECASPSHLTSMTFDYFKTFPNAQELDIALISPKGQTSYEVKRDKPSLDLTGVM